MQTASGMLRTNATPTSGSVESVVRIAPKISCQSELTMQAGLRSKRRARLIFSLILLAVLVPQL